MVLAAAKLSKLLLKNAKMFETFLKNKIHNFSQILLKFVLINFA